LSTDVVDILILYFFIFVDAKIGKKCSMSTRSNAHPGLYDYNKALFIAALNTVYVKAHMPKTSVVKGIIVSQL
jgi:hypothetical protein